MNTSPTRGMPGYKTTHKKRGAAASSALKANGRAVSAAMTSSDTLFARVDARLGTYFRLCKNDGSMCQGSPRGLFTSRNMPMSRGDIVILEASSTHVHEIIGRLSKEEAATLYAAKRLSKEVYCSEEGEQDELFEYAAPEGGNVDIDTI